MTDLEEELSEKMSAILAEEIDWELIVDLMVSVGWTRVRLERFDHRHHAIDIHDWLVENCSGHYKSRGSTFVFEKAEEAEWFSLRWL